MVITTLKTVKLRLPPAHACLSDPCLHGGTCIDVFDGSYKCICKEGWTGDHCDCKTKDTTCRIKGKCVVFFFV